MNYLIDNEKCPKCNEEWVQGQGLNCANNCEDKLLEEKHRVAVKPMVDYCLLPKYWANTNCPSDTPIEYLDREDKGWGWTTLYNKTITIPWYTLRNEEEFFDTVPHEAAHISSTEIKFPSPSNQKIVAKYQQLENQDKDEGKSHPSPATLKYYRQNKILIKNWKSGIHGKDYWQEEFKRLHGKLMESEYAKYNYFNSPPKIRRHSIYSQSSKKYYDPNDLLWWK